MSSTTAQCPISEHEPVLARIIRDYFCSPNRQCQVLAGIAVLEQSGHNDRLYYLKSGSMAAYYQETDSSHPVLVFQVEAGMFFGVHSFFAGTFKASTTVIAQTDCELAWIDISTKAVNEDTHGSLSAQFMPVMVSELSKRQQRASLKAVANAQSQQKLFRAEQMTTLGQLAAGIAHELNNAVGVIDSKAQRLQDTLSSWLATYQPDAQPFFDVGLSQGQGVSSSEARARGKTFEKQHGLSSNKARLLARALPQDADINVWLADLDNALHFWEQGRELHDLQIAAQHAVYIVRSVKQLGGADHERNEHVDINDTLQKSLSLLQGAIRGVTVTQTFGDLPLLVGSSTEFVQIWVNLIKNATEALADTPSPNIDIYTFTSKGWLIVTIANNGPVIEESVRRKIFQPNFTTRKGGLSFGLGLGLSIVQRLVNEYNGSIAVKSDADITTFRVRLPLGE
ncbi:ATP-binding protein [Enterovibrio norvegicus]|uniref:ATP-binding protein n=1 Tax=Enterovibrio norvegicus TaxID=188144 RepID=UPI000C856FF2|nr:ATP-binding protein [Enterovibrio norvegicus]PMH72294.1 histidine kinase [Enterovibrio norvegicus]